MSLTPAAPPPKGRTAAGDEWRAYWGIVLTGFLGTSFITLPSVTLGMFMGPLESEFGWSRAEVSFGMTIFALVGTPLAPFAGALADRFGSRRIAVPGALLNSLAFAAFGLMTGFYWQFAAIWVIYTLTQLLVRSTIWNRAAAASFSASLGLAMALIIGGIALAQTLGPVVAQWLIANHGWRAAYIGIGLGWGGLVFLSCLLLFREARDKPVAAGSAAPAPGGALPGIDFGVALRSSRIWRIALAALLQSVIGAGLMIHLFPLLTEQGIARETAAGILSFMGLAAICGQFMTGFLCDRTATTLLPMSAFFFPAMAFTFVLNADGALPLLMAGVFCAGFGMASCVMMINYLTSRYVGVRNFGKVHGIMSGCMGLGGGLGPLLAGVLYDFNGGYGLFLAAGALIALLNVALVCRLGPYPDLASGVRNGETATNGKH